MISSLVEKNGIDVKNPGNKYGSSANKRNDYHFFFFFVIVIFYENKNKNKNDQTNNWLI